MSLMRKLSAVSLAAALTVPLAVPAPQALAETPPNILVIATRIDDITTLDPQAQAVRRNAVRPRRKSQGRDHEH